MDIQVRNRRKRNYILWFLALLALIVLGPISYSGGVLETEIEFQDKYFSARVDLVPVVDAVLKDNTVLKAVVKEAFRSIKIRDGIIDGQRDTITGQDRMIGNMADEILELENRPPEIVTVEVPVEVIVEKVVEVEVPVEVIVEKVIYIEVAPIPVVNSIYETEWDNSGDNDNDNSVESDPTPEPEPAPTPEPEPAPDDNCNRHKRDRGHWGHK